jgi:two-component system, chemotaxis family, response regulator Rcp1
VVSCAAGDPGRDLLIVDDDEAQACLFAHLLRKSGIPHRCHHATDGPKALEFLRRKGRYENAPKPQLIILDLNMPGMDGCAVLREIKADPELHCIPVIMFSLATCHDDFDRCYSERANACIRKPDDYEGTLNVVREIERFWFHTAQLPVSPVP